MKFIGTRGTQEKVTFSEAILNPAAPKGGLFAPETLPEFSETFIQNHLNKSYKELALSILTLFSIDIETELLDEALSLYETKFDTKQTVPVKRVESDLYIAELWHGPTRAFKDMALQPFGVVLSALARKKEENYLILAATSGDTGPATLETFKNREFIKVACMYPDGGTSDVQRLQMVTIDANNEKVLGVKGSFDDTQNALKSLLNSESFKETLKENNIKLSAANSVNFGRIIFQTIYHVWAYIQLINQEAIKEGDLIDIIVPSGNFGNALGGYYAKKMGLPLDKIIIASNANNILTEFIHDGRYDLREKELQKTASPAMDILKSSNIERILFDNFGDKRVAELMQQLEKKGFFQLEQGEIAQIKADFDATFATDAECFDYINEYATKGYLMDTHTATAIKSYKIKKEGKKMVAYSTAEWTKFAPSLYEALRGEKVKSDNEAIEFITQTFSAKMPESIKSLFTREVTQTEIIKKEHIEKTIIDFIKE